MATQHESDGPPAPRDELLALTDELLNQASELRRHWSYLHQALRGESSERPERTPDEVEPNADPRRLIAVDMILAGRSRDEVHAFLESEYGAGSAAEVMADIYGADWKVRD